MVFSGSFRQGKHQQILTHRLVLHPAHKLKDIVKKGDVWVILSLFNGANMNYKVSSNERTYCETIIVQKAIIK